MRQSRSQKDGTTQSSKKIRRTLRLRRVCSFTSLYILSALYLLFDVAHQIRGGARGLLDLGEAVHVRTGAVQMFGENIGIS